MLFPVYVAMITIIIMLMAIICFVVHAVSVQYLHSRIIQRCIFSLYIYIIYNVTKLTILNLTCSNTPFPPLPPYFSLFFINKPSLKLPILFIDSFTIKLNHCVEPLEFVSLCKIKSN